MKRDAHVLSREVGHKYPLWESASHDTLVLYKYKGSRKFERRWGWIGYTIRKPVGSITPQASTSARRGKETDDNGEAGSAAIWNHVSRTIYVTETIGETAARPECLVEL